MLWGATPTELWAVDPATGAVTTRVPLTDSTEVMALALEGTTAWVGLLTPGFVGGVVEVDLADSNVLREVPVDIPWRGSRRVRIGVGQRLRQLARAQVGPLTPA